MRQSHRNGSPASTAIFTRYLFGVQDFIRGAAVAARRSLDHRHLDRYPVSSYAAHACDGTRKAAPCARSQKARAQGFVCRKVCKPSTATSALRSTPRNGSAPGWCWRASSVGRRGCGLPPTRASAGPTSPPSLRPEPLEDCRGHPRAGPAAARLPVSLGDRLGRRLRTRGPRGGRGRCEGAARAAGRLCLPPACTGNIVRTLRRVRWATAPICRRASPKLTSNRAQMAPLSRARPASGLRHHPG